MTIDIPPGIVQQAFTTIEAINARGMKHPSTLTSTCRQVAVVILSKWNEKTDPKVLRHLTNQMVYHIYDVEAVKEVGK